MVEGESQLSVGQAVARYAGGIALEDRERVSQELARFVRWFGGDRPLSSMAAPDVGRYQEQLMESRVDATPRLEALKAFLAYAGKERWVPKNLAAQVRLKKRGEEERRAGSAESEKVVRLTAEGLSQLRNELERLEQDVRPALAATLQGAYADGDFRENAPYHAAKESLSQVQGRINQLRATLQSAQVAENASTEKADLGAVVVLKDLATGDEQTYILVGPGNTDARRGRISIESPVGRALLDRTVGETVEVAVPAGQAAFRIERIYRE